MGYAWNTGADSKGTSGAAGTIEGWRDRAMPCSRCASAIRYCTCMAGVPSMGRLKTRTGKGPDAKGGRNTDYPEGREPTTEDATVG